MENSLKGISEDSQSEQMSQQDGGESTHESQFESRPPYYKSANPKQNGVARVMADPDQYGLIGSDISEFSTVQAVDRQRSNRQANAAESNQVRSMVITPSPMKKRGPTFEPQLTINIMYTQYDIIHEVAQDCNLRTSIEEEEDWDIWFIDGPTLPSLLQKMKSYQRTNHFPGIYVIGRKNLLARNLLGMQKYFPELYQFFPKTWLLPADLKSFKEQFNHRKAKTFIIKPEASSQGKGIFLTRNYDWMNPQEHYVAQRYLPKPYLIDGLKFDLRVYVNVTCFNPLRIFIYREGLARFATDAYNSPIGSNLSNLYMHLTNYAINKEAENFQQNAGYDNQGHKRSMTSIFAHIDAARAKDPEIISSEQCWQDIKDLTVKTLISCQSQVGHIFRSAKPQDIEGSLCMHILGFDIFLNNKAKPILIEVNQSPSFMTDSPLDHKVKKGLLIDSIRQLSLNWKRKNKYLNQQRQEMKDRLIGAKRITLEERELLRTKKIKLKDKHELQYSGNFERIYPVPADELAKSERARAQQEMYDLLIEANHAVFGEQQAGGGVCAKQKIEDLLRSHANKKKGPKRQADTRSPGTSEKPKQLKVIPNYSELFRDQKQSGLAANPAEHSDHPKQSKDRAHKETNSQNVKLQAALAEQGLLMPPTAYFIEEDMKSLAIHKNNTHYFNQANQLHQDLLKAGALQNSRVPAQSMKQSSGFSIQIKEMHQPREYQPISHNRLMGNLRVPSNLTQNKLVSSQNQKLRQETYVEQPQTDARDKRRHETGIRGRETEHMNSYDNRQDNLSSIVEFAGNPLQSTGQLQNKMSQSKIQLANVQVGHGLKNSYDQQLQNHRVVKSRGKQSLNSGSLQNSQQDLSRRQSRESLQAPPQSASIQNNTQPRLKCPVNRKPQNFAIHASTTQAEQHSLHFQQAEKQLKPLASPAKKFEKMANPAPVQLSHEKPPPIVVHSAYQMNLSSSAAFYSYKEQLNQVINQQNQYSNNKQKTNRQNSTNEAKLSDGSPTLQSKNNGSQAQQFIKSTADSTQKVLPHQILAAQHGCIISSPRQDYRANHHYQKQQQTSQPASQLNPAYQANYTMKHEQQLFPLQHLQRYVLPTGVMRQVSTRPPIAGTNLVLQGSQIKSDK